MKCRSCDAEIADKAIVCYRCGTPTAAPVRPPAAATARGTARGRWVAVVVLIVLAAVAWAIWLR